MPYDGDASTSALIDELQSEIQVRHIMTPRSRFRSGTDEEDARALLDDPSCADYDLIPFPNQSGPTSYVLRSNRRAYNIDRDHLISDSTSVIELIQYFDTDRHVLFVLKGNRIVGLAHLSDLNSTVSKIAFFTLLSNVERACLELFRAGIPDQLLVQAFKRKKREQIKDRIHDMRENDALPFDAAALYFKEALALTREAQLAALSDAELEALNRARNHTSHAGQVLLATPAGILEIQEVVRVCERLLTELQLRSREETIVGRCDNERPTASSATR
jgi:hypothetical protein